VDLDDVAPVVEVGPRLAPAAVALLVVFIVGRGCAVGDDEAVVVGRRLRRRQAGLPEVARLGRLRVVVARHVGGHAIHVQEELPLGHIVPDAGADAGHVVVVGAEAQDDFLARRHRAEGHAVEGVVAVVAQAVVFDVVVVTVAQRVDVDAHGVRGINEGEDDARAGGGHGEADVATIRKAGMVPILVYSALTLPIAGWNVGRLEGVGAVVVGIGHPATQAVGRPVTGAADLLLPIADGNDDQLGAVTDEVGLVVVVELDGVVRAGQRHVAAGERDIPGVVERRLILLSARGHVERTLPDVVGGVVGQVGRGAFGLPVAGAA